MESKKRWLNGPVCDLECGEVESIVKAQMRSAQRLVKVFKGGQITHRVASEFKEDVE